AHGAGDAVGLPPGGAAERYQGQPVANVGPVGVPAADGAAVLGKPGAVLVAGMALAPVHHARNSDVPARGEPAVTAPRFARDGDMAPAARVLLDHEDFAGAGHQTASLHATQSFCTCEALTP